VLPCYNGGPYLEQNLQRFQKFLGSLEMSWELVVVDDGSSDETAAVLQRLESTMPGLVVLRNGRNMGKGYAVRNGVLHCSGRLVMFTDPDMTYAWENVGTLLDRLRAGCRMVVANRRLPDSVYTVKNELVRYVYRRHRTGLLFNLLIRLLFGLKHTDTQSGLKGFPREVAMAIFERVHTHGYLFDVEVFIVAKKLGLKVEEIPVHLTYETDYTTVKQIRYFFQLVPELIQIKSLELRGAYNPDSRGAELP